MALTGNTDGRNLLTDAVHFLRSYFSGQPSYAIFFVTAICNARCKHCFYWEEIGSAKASQELQLPEIEKMSRSLRLIYLSVGGGEPFLRKDLAEIVKAFYDNSGLLFCNIVTNGYYTEQTAAVVRRILAECPRLRLKIQVSIDDFEKEHDENRKVPGIYRRALATIRQLSADFRSKEERFSLDIATCLTRSNKTHAMELMTHLRDSAAFDNFSFLYPRGNAEVKEEKDVTPQEYKAAIALIEKAEFRDNNNSILGAVQRVARKGILSVVEKDAYPWPCLGGKKFVNITERGVLQPCEILGQMLPAYKSDMADLHDFDFDVRKALAAKKSKEVVRFIKDSKCKCSFECAAMNNAVFDKRNAAKVLWTWITGSSA
ncbi:MAG: radical SAM protein [Elusimicrobia bacterium]|nr:radical SAM protein [Elusimicrobiota bacterium]